MDVLELSPSPAAPSRVLWLSPRSCCQVRGVPLHAAVTGMATTCSYVPPTGKSGPQVCCLNEGRDCFSLLHEIFLPASHIGCAQSTRGWRGALGTAEHLGAESWLHSAPASPYLPPPLIGTDKGISVHR